MEAEVADEADEADRAGMARGDEGGAPDETPLDQLEYTAGRALERALALRAPLEDAIVGEDPVGPILDEVFDLSRLGRK